MASERNGLLSFPLQSNPEELIQSISDELVAKGYSADSEKPEFSVEKPELHYEPYYFFHYDAMVESAPAAKPESGEVESEEELAEESDDGASRGVESGATSIHAISKQFNEELSSLMGEFEPEPLHAKKIPKPLFSLEEIRKIALVHLASKLGTKRENIEITAIRLVYVPFYAIAATVEGQDFPLEANAVTGEVSGLDEVPERGKSGKELAHEAFQDLANPRKWASHPAGFAKHSAGWFYNNPQLRALGHVILTDRRAQIVILLIILLFILLRAYRFI